MRKTQISRILRCWKIEKIKIQLKTSK
jgi:hypothetical protein